MNLRVSNRRGIAFLNHAKTQRSFDDVQLLVVLKHCWLCCWCVAPVYTGIDPCCLDLLVLISAKTHEGTWSVPISIHKIYGLIKV